jgi:beta-glucosidase
MSAKESSSQGIKWTFAPMMDISRDPRWGRVAESFGEDPILAGIMASAMVKGLQGNNETWNIAACSKHFVGYGAAEGGRDYNTTLIPESELRNVYLVPFKYANDAGVMTVMSSFNDLNGIPASANKHNLTDILRGEWQFKGFVVTDWRTPYEMPIHGYTETEKEAAEKCLNAGIDMEMVSQTFFNNAKQLIAENKLYGYQIDENIRRILRVKFQLGLFDHPYEIPKKSILLSAENLQIAKEIAEQSIVLLKNEKNILPLTHQKTIAIVGPMADAKLDQLGCWSLDGKAEDTKTPLMTLRNELKEAKLLYAQGAIDCKSNDESKIDEAVKIASQADVILFFCGEEAKMSGEAHSRAFLDLPGIQNKLLAKLATLKKPIVTIIMAGRPLTLETVNSISTAILYAWHPGTMGGPAISDILLGKVNPSGRLPMTFPRSVGQIPMYYNHRNTGRPANLEDHNLIPSGTPLDPKDFTSSYIDLSMKPMYPFGFGLSYTSFSYSKLELSSSSISMDGELKVNCTITNTGKNAGYETAQLYIHDKYASLTRPVKELKAFQKIMLQAGESRIVEFTLKTSDLGFYNNDNVFVIEHGSFDIWVGSNAMEGLHDTFIIANPMKQQH